MQILYICISLKSLAAMKKLILHLCADIGSDSIYFQKDPNFEVLLIGKEIGVENYHPPENVYGIIANPVCTELSTLHGFDKKRDIQKGMFLVNHCIRIMNECYPKFWVLENPYNGVLKTQIGAPMYVYQPWEFGSPWTKKTALWGFFNKPHKLYDSWDKVPKIKNLYSRPGRSKPGLNYLHKSAVELIPEFQWAKDKIKTDADLRSMCSNGFARQFYLHNKNS